MILGDEDVSGLSDQTLKDSLWENFFDLKKTIQWAVGRSMLSNVVRNELKRLPQQNRKGGMWRNNVKVSIILVSV